MPHPRPAAWHAEQAALERSWLDQFARGQAAAPDTPRAGADAEPLADWDAYARFIGCPPPIPA